MFAVGAMDGGWPCFDEAADREISIVSELAALIQEDQVVVLQEVGYEKLRYLTAHATAFDSKGKAVELDMDDIFKLAAKRFKVQRDDISLCQY
jgi:hypothetical protein